MVKLFTDDGLIVCPQCNEPQNILAYTHLKHLNKEETAPIIKCRLCRFVFAPLTDDQVKIEKLKKLDNY